MIKAVVFDFDDTLVDTKGFVIEHMARTIEEVDGEVDEMQIEMLKDVLYENLHFEEIFQRLFSENWELYLSKYRETAPMTSYKPMPGMLELVEELKEKDVKLYILSNRTRMLEDRMAQAGFVPSDFKIYSALEGHRKPDQLAYTPVLEELDRDKIEKNEVLVIGNHPDDYLALPDEWKERFRAIPDSEIQRERFVGLTELPEEEIYKEVSHIKIS
jgi:FMN phosphatase YigB (HAD superfamily)